MRFSGIIYQGTVGLSRPWLETECNQNILFEPLFPSRVDSDLQYPGELLRIKFPFKRKGLPSCSASLHVNAKNIRVLQISRPYLGFFVQNLNMIKHFIVNLKKTIVN